MAPVHGCPFLECLLDRARRFGFFDIVLSVGYRAEVIEGHFGDSASFGVSIEYSHEHELVGTGGTLRQAQPLIHSGPVLQIGRLGENTSMARAKLPRISVVTPSFNCGSYLRDCIESVLAQDYDNFEHLIVDGASQDGTVEILRSYPHLRWVSEPDSGEAEALNKALRMAHGDIVAWLNADDYYLEGALTTAARELDPAQNRHAVYGKTNIVHEDGSLVSLQTPHSSVTLKSLTRWFSHLGLYQPSMFYTRDVVQDVGYYREDLRYSIDYDYWLRVVAKGYSFHFVDQVFSEMRLMRGEAKSAAPLADKERDWFRVCLPYVRDFALAEKFRYWRDFYIRYRFPHPVLWLRICLRPRARLRSVLRRLRYAYRGSL